MPIEESLHGHCPLPVWTWHMKSGIALIAVAGARAIYAPLAGLTRCIRFDRVRLIGLIGRRQARWGAINVALYWVFYFRFDVSDLLQNGGVFMKSPVVKRSTIIASHETSVSLEDAFWKRLKKIAERRQMTLSDLVSAIDSRRQHSNLSSALRLFVLDFYCSQHSRIKEARDGTHGVIVRTASS